LYEKDDDWADYTFKEDVPMTTISLAEQKTLAKAHYDGGRY
jgi:hypothetical protein